jgi:hypothetical protein
MHSYLLQDLAHLAASLLPHNHWTYYKYPDSPLHTNPFVVSAVLQCFLNGKTDLSFFFIAGVSPWDVGQDSTIQVHQLEAQTSTDFWDNEDTKVLDLIMN